MERITVEFFHAERVVELHKKKIFFFVFVVYRYLKIHEDDTYFCYLLQYLCFYFINVTSTLLSCSLVHSKTCILYFVSESNHNKNIFGKITHEDRLRNNWLLVNSYFLCLNVISTWFT